MSLFLADQNIVFFLLSHHVRVLPECAYMFSVLPIPRGSSKPHSQLCLRTIWCFQPPSQPLMLRVKCRRVLFFCVCGMTQLWILVHMFPASEQAHWTTKIVNSQAMALFFLCVLKYLDKTV